MKNRLLLIFVLLLGCRREKPPLVTSTPKDFEKAMAFIDHRNDSAYYYFNKVVNTSKDSLFIARAYNNMAEIQTDAGDYSGSQERLTTSLKFLNELKANNHHCLSADYNELGLTSLLLRHYEVAIGYYDRAIKFTDDKEEQGIIYNNQGNVYQEQKDYNHGLSYYQQALALLPAGGKTYAQVLTNMTFTRWLKNKSYRAAPELLKALAIREKIMDDWGKNASYAHLSDYYGASKPDSALFYAQKLYETARHVNSPDDKLDALQKLIKLGPERKAREYFPAYQHLNDSLQAAHNAAKNQFALIRYESEKNKTDNLQLQKDNAEKKFQVTGLLFFLLISTVVILFWYRRIRWDAKEKLLKLSQKVHDVVANGIYRVMSQVEHGETVDKENLLDQLEVMYEQSRDITYENEKLLTDFALEVQTLLNSFKGGLVKLAVDGNENKLWKVVNDEIKRAIVPVLQELMVNMNKHSQATQALVAFEVKDFQLQIDYKDNGVGLPDSQEFGNGLRNTGNRIRALKGSVNFVTDGGAKIHITIPLT